MDPLTAIGTGLSIIGGVQSLFEKPHDPYAEQRKQMESLLKKIETEPQRQRARLAAEFAPAREAAMKRIQDQSAAAGLPRNVQMQHIQTAGQQHMNALLNEIARLSQGNMEKYNLMAQMVGAIPPVPEQNWGGDMLGLGLQLATLPKKQPGLPGIDATQGIGMTPAVGGASQTFSNQLGNFSFSRFAPQMNINTTLGGR